MHGPGHHATGMATGVVVGFFAYKYFGFSELTSAGTAVAGWVGGVFPDRVEKPLGIRIIPHRTITHWVIPWVAAFLLVLVFPQLVGLEYGIVHLCVIAFIAGALTHLLFDLPTPSGIPVLTPVESRSLNLWNSGRNDILLSAAWWLLCGLIVAPGMVFEGVGHAFSAAGFDADSITAQMAAIAGIR